MPAALVPLALSVYALLCLFVFAGPEWQRVQIPWSEFAANRVSEPLDTRRLTRIAILGWMREFQADIALAEIALYA